MFGGSADQRAVAGSVSRAGSIAGRVFRYDRTWQHRVLAVKFSTIGAGVDGARQAQQAVE